MGKKQQVVYHAKCPIDRINRGVFIADVSFEGKNPEERNHIIRTCLEKCAADLFAIDLQPYLRLTEFRGEQQMADGVKRTGTQFTIDIMVGKVPLVQLPDGRDVITENDKENNLIEVHGKMGHN